MIIIQLLLRGGSAEGLGFKVLGFGGSGFRGLLLLVFGFSWGLGQGFGGLGV